ncbi:GGDEF and EAL domain-containing protein [uncultured Sphingomonas sp.]|uniref:sensor domain-containing protein n=1 Tax=uncultured Sphingomonas sp. TaxID=158754 RepID=UPI0025F02BB8|nr:GGDEF and EAL domain-containing protein [uncultured Sphingomonas sp.]
MRDSGSRVERDDVEVAPRRILDLLPGLVAYFGADLRYRYANATYADWRGLHPREIVGRHVRHVVGERNYPVIEERLRRALAGERVVYEYYIFDDDFRRRVQGSYVPDFDEDGRVVGVITLVTDISRRDDLQLRIAESEAMFNEAFENAPNGAAMVGLDGHVIRCNLAFATMLGRSVEEMQALNFSAVTHPDDVDADLDLFGSVLRKERNGYCLDKRYVRADGTCIDARLAVSAIRDDGGDVIRFFSHIEDVTQQRAAERKLIETNARLSLVSEAIRGGSWHFDVATGRFETSDALAQFIGGAGTQPLDLAGYCGHIDPLDLPQCTLEPLIEGEADRSSVQYRLQTQTGVHWMRCDRRLLRDAHGRPEKIVGVAIDMTEEHHRAMRAEFQASTDPLTGLLNRRGLQQRLEQLSPGSACGILAIDLDGFKQVNDRLGHDIGDAVLVEAGARLRAMVRDTDLVARLGGDEFVMILAGIDVAGLERLAERATQALGEGFAAVGGSDLRVAASVGATWLPHPPTSTDSMSRADAALYEAKAAGRGTWRLLP